MAFTEVDSVGTEGDKITCFFIPGSGVGLSVWDLLTIIIEAIATNSVSHLVTEWGHLGASTTLDGKKIDDDDKR